MYLVASGHIFVDLLDLVCLCEHWKGKQKPLLEQLSHTLRAAHSVRYAKKISHDRGGIKENLFRWKKLQ